MEVTFRDGRSKGGGHDEPGHSRGGKQGAVGFEQNLIVHRDGVEVITTTPIYWE
ncbi:MAG: hypothetical protein OXC15_19075 [Rhodospirillaceae bacterium]|nr:hypothetical protein [Rhodospirillaceae bacterium]